MSEAFLTILEPIAFLPLVYQIVKFVTVLLISYDSGASRPVPAFIQNHENDDSPMQFT